MLIKGVPPARAACIVGVGETEYRKWGGFNDRSELSLACEAIKNAADDAGVPLREIDGFSSFANDPNESQLLQLVLGTGPLHFTAAHWGGGGAGACGAVGLAARAVESGAAETVAVVRAIAQGQRGRFGQFRAGRPFSNFTTPFGLFGPPQMLALTAMRYMKTYGATEEHMFKVVANARGHASRNPRAIFQSKPPLTMEEYLASRWISEPFRLFDCTVETDGACAVIITTRERAKALRQKPVQVLAAEQGSNPRWGNGAIGTHTHPYEEYTTGNHAELAKRLYACAEVDTADIKVAQIYDNFSLMPLFGLEDYGFCGRGEAPAFLDSGGISGRTPRLSLNTSGGHLAEGYMHGLNHVLEGARQVRGNSTSQVSDAELCLVVSSLSIAPNSSLILGRAA